MTISVRSKPFKGHSWQGTQTTCLCFVNTWCDIDKEFPIGYLPMMHFLFSGSVSFQNWKVRIDLRYPFTNEVLQAKISEAKKVYEMKPLIQWRNIYVEFPLCTAVVLHMQTMMRSHQACGSTLYQISWCFAPRPISHSGQSEICYLSLSYVAAIFRAGNETMPHYVTKRWACADLTLSNVTLWQEIVMESGENHHLLLPVI